jgi:F-type H+-transporting ATPase subunit b
VELSWTTFILEAINFLVLVWLLKRLFYAPVKRAIAARRSAVDKTLKDAESTRHVAEDLKFEYQGRLQEWEEEKERQREEFRKELDEEKTRQLKAIQAAVALEREKAEVLEKKHAAERRTQDEKQAIKQALEFTSHLLSGLASSALEGRIVDLVIEHISSARIGDLPVGAPQSGDHLAGAQVRSAYSLAMPQRDALSTALKLKLGAELRISFEVDKNLVAGLEIAIGSYVLHANLRDELEYFSTTSNHE